MTRFAIRGLLSRKLRTALTALAIARTLADVAPNHPLTKHLTVAYWKGGDTAVE